MQSFHDTATSAAPPEEVWKLLYDPARFPDWWAGSRPSSAATGRVHDLSGGLSRLPDGAAARHATRPAARDGLVPGVGPALRVAASAGGDGTLITVDVEIPDAEAHRLEGQQGGDQRLDAPAREQAVDT